MPRAPLWLPPCLAFALACASAPAPLPAGVSAAPAVGDPLALLLTKLQHAEGAPAAITPRELRAIAVDREPWQPLALDAAAEQPGAVALIAGRRCSWREGLSRHEVERASWFLLRAGVLTAFDHQGFGAACASRAAFEPGAADQVGLERSLMRYLSQRWPAGEISAEQRLARGLRLLEHGRSDDARFELHALDRRIDELSRRQTEYETPDAAVRERLRREEETLRPMRAQLYHALSESAPKEDVLP